MSTGRKRSLTATVDSVIWVALLWLVMVLPWSDTLFHLDRSPELPEKRMLAPKPVWQWTWKAVDQFPHAFDAYLRDHIGFRKLQIRAYNSIHALLMGVSPTTRVVIGHDGWLYWGGPVLDCYRGVYPYPAEQAARLSRILEERRVWLEQLGIAYQVVFAPEKATLYPEFVPARFNRASETTPLDRAIEYVHRYTPLDVSSFHACLREAKGERLLYQRTGTHWNDWGAYVAYRDLANHLATQFEGIKPIPETDLAFEVRTVKGHDLAELLSLNDVLMEKDEPFLKILRPTAVRTPVDIPSQFPEFPSFAMETGREELPRAVLFRDSYADAMYPFLSEHFERIVIVYQGSIEAEVVKSERPDIVIQEIAERGIIEPFPENSLEVSRPYLEKQYAESTDVRFDMHRRDDAQAAQPVGRVAVQPTQDWWQVSFADPASRIRLPLRNAANVSLLVARLDLSAEKESLLRVSLRQRKPNKWVGERFLTAAIRNRVGMADKPKDEELREVAIETPLQSGRNVYYVPLEARDLYGDLMLGLDPGIEYRVHDLQIRNVLYPHETTGVMQTTTK